MTMLIENQFYDGSKFKNVYPLSVSGFISNRAHDLCSRNICCDMDSFPTCSPEMKHFETAIRILIKHGPQTLEPLKNGGGLSHKGVNQLRNIREMSSPNRIKIMIIGWVLPGLISRLDASLGHHRIGIPMPQFRRNDHPSSMLLCK
jgi:hypothetical protein